MPSTQRQTIVTSLSGGKDSTATAILALLHAGDDRRQCRFVFADTGNEHSLTYEYIQEYLQRRLDIHVDTVRRDFTADIARKRTFIKERWPGDGVPDEFVRRSLEVLEQPTGVPFLDLCLWKGRFPSRKAQFCTQELKRRPIELYLLELLAERRDVSSWQGVRRDESPGRSGALMWEYAPEGWLTVRPIVEWDARRVVEFVRAQGVDLNPLYRMGMARVGCMPCINCRKDELAEIARRFPEHIDKVRAWERLVSEASKRGYSTFFHAHERRHYAGMSSAAIFGIASIDAQVDWARTSRGGRHYDLEKAAPPAQCASVYGLCE